MHPETTDPGALAGAAGAANSVSWAVLDGRHHSPSPLNLAIILLGCRYGLPPATAATIAELAGLGRVGAA